MENHKLSLVKNKDYAPTEDFNTLNEDGKTSKGDKKSKNNNTVNDEPSKKKQKLIKIRKDPLVSVLFRESETQKCNAYKSPLISNKEMSPTSTDEVPIVINCEESVESADNFSAKYVKSTIRVIDPRAVINGEDRYLKFVDEFESSQKKSSLRSAEVNVVTQPLNYIKHIKKILIIIEKLHNKYFTQLVQDTIVTIANLLSIISMLEKHYQAKINKSLDKRSEAEILKKISSGNHKKILETKLKNNFSDIVSSFEVSDFDIAFKMLFLSIFTVLRVLDQPKFRKGNDVFNDVLHFLWNSLRNSNYEHPRIVSMFRSKKFHPDCVDLISTIEDCRGTDPGVIDRMPLYFIATSKSKIYFQAVIDAVIGDSNEDLALLIDNATSQCCSSSKFKDNIVSSTCQKTLTLNGNKSLTIGNTTEEPSIATSQPIKNFDESLPSSLQKKTSESFTSKVIPTKECMAVTQTISNSPLKQITSSRSETATSTSGQERVNGTNKLVEPPPTRFINCSTKNCKRSATTKCSVCKTAKYCSKYCQIIDWHENHEKDCERLQNINKT